MSQATETQSGRPIPTDFSFDFITGVGSRLDAAIKRNYTTWDELALVKVEALLDLRGMSKVAAGQVIQTAEEQLVLQDEADIQARIPHTVARKDGAEKLYIISKKRVDPYNVVCKRVELTPGVCEICGFDLLAHNGLQAWEDLSAERKTTVREAMAMHKRDMHMGSDAKQIITADELKTLGFPRRDEVYDGKTGVFKTNQNLEQSA
jgi:hypothetical protein